MNKDRIALPSSNPTSGPLSEAMELFMFTAELLLLLNTEPLYPSMNGCVEKIAVLIQNNTKSSKETNPAHVP